MEFSSISIEQTKRFNRLISDYIKADENVKPFYGLHHSVENYKAKIEERKQFNFERNVLADALIEQYDSIGGANGTVLQNIELLRNDNAFTVTTGHQLNIFTGPLYFIYKILHTIRLADELNQKYTEFKFVPIYWMNSEDHDIEEVGKFNLFGDSHVWRTEQTGSTGRMNPEALVEFCDILDQTFSNSPQTQELIGIFRSAYANSKSLAQATRSFSNALFGSRGLVIIDSDDARLKKPFIRFIKQDAIENTPFKLVKSASLALEKNGYNHQVNPREINSFYLSDGIRNRIVRSENGYHVLKTKIRFTEAELIAEIENHPERFSPNVVLRPLFQEFILPNLTYVGGAGELSYWLQYKEYFGQMKVSFPMLSLRNHFLLIDERTEKQISELNIAVSDFFGSVDDVIKKFLFENSDVQVDITEELALLQKLYGKLAQRAEEIDESLSSSVKSEQARMEKAVEQWQGRFTRGLKQKNEVSVNRIRKIHKRLFPSGYLQERHDNFMAFYANNPEGFFDELFEAMRPFKTEFSIATI